MLKRSFIYKIVLKNFDSYRPSSWDLMYADHGRFSRVFGCVQQLSQCHMTWFPMVSKMKHSHCTINHQAFKNVKMDHNQYIIQNHSSSFRSKDSWDTVRTLRCLLTLHYLKKSKSNNHNQPFRNKTNYFIYLLLYRMKKSL